MTLAPGLYGSASVGRNSELGPEPARQLGPALRDHDIALKHVADVRTVANIRAPLRLQCYSTICRLTFL